MYPADVQMLNCSLKSLLTFTWISSLLSAAQTPALGVDRGDHRRLVLLAVEDPGRSLHARR